MGGEIRTARHSIQVVAGRTGLSPDVIRAWERRYQAIDPERSATRRRLYSDEDVARLILLRRATLAGRRIGEVAKLSYAELAALVDEDTAALARAPASAESDSARSARHYLDICLQAASRLDAAKLEAALHRASMELAMSELFDSVLTPLLEQIGERWLRGTLSIAHEHLATATVRRLLDALRASSSNAVSESTLIAATPAGEYHELGALKVAVLAAVEGWRSVYLGPNLPVEEIIGAAAALKARVVALSLVHLEHDPELEMQLRQMVDSLPKSALLIVGGQGAGHYRPVLSRTGALMPANMTELRQELVRLG